MTKTIASRQHDYHLRTRTSTYRILAAVSIVLVLAGSNVEATAKVVFDSGVPLDDGSTIGLFSNDPSPTNGFQVAGDFMLKGDAKVFSSVRWYGAYGNNTEIGFSPTFAVDNFQIRIYASQGDRPVDGPPLHELAIANSALRVNLGPHDYLFHPVAGDIFEYTTHFDPIGLDANITYWLSIVNQEQGPEDLWFWAGRNSGNAAIRRNSGSRRLWSLEQNLDVSFLLLVPEPNTAIPITVAMIGCILQSRRRI